MKNALLLKENEKPLNKATLKTPIWFLLSIFLLLSMLLASSNEDNTGLIHNNPDETASTAIKRAALIQKDFVGNIIDEKGRPLEGVAVSIGDKYITTDVNGKFVINNAYVKVHQAYVIAEKSGYSKGLLTVKPTDGTNVICIKIIKENMVAALVSGTK